MTPELRTYHPSARERTEQFLRDLLAGDRRTSAVQASQVRGIMDVLDYTPVVGNAFALDDAGTMLDAGIANRNPWQVAGGVGLGALVALPSARKVLKDPIARAARSSMFDPPKKPARPFEADYPGTIPVDTQGRLTEDIEGRPLMARWVVGRNVAGGRDEAFPTTEFDTLSNATTRAGTTTVSPRYMKEDLELGSLGATYFDEGGPVSIVLRSDLPKGERRRIYAHELGHAIDGLEGQLTKNLSQELDRVYNTLNNPIRTFRGGEAHPFFPPVKPENRGYNGEEVAPEYWAEAIRAYLSDPNYLKTVAPQVAAAIRAAANANPRLNKIIQFNSALVPLAGADILSPPDDKSSPNANARKGPAARARTDPSDPRASDRLSIEDWMKMRREQLR